MKGNVVDLAVAVIVDAASDKVMGGVNFSDRFIQPGSVETGQRRLGYGEQAA